MTSISRASVLQSSRSVGVVKSGPALYDHGMGEITVFISYSHKDEEWKEKLVPHLQALEHAGIGMHVWHDRKIDGGDKWYPEIQEAMTNAAAAILLISSDFLASRFCVQEEVPALLKRQENEGMLLIPVLLRACPWKAHRWLKDRQMLPRDGKCVAIDFAGHHADAVFAAVAEQVLSHFEQLANRSAATLVVPVPVQRLAALRTVAVDPSIIPPAPVVPWPALSTECIDLTRLPETGSALFGRDEELALLDQAWASPEQASTAPVRVLAFTAHGGVGKSTLVNHWLAEMARDHCRGATRVFGWSFYSQGVREETAGADTFIDAALRFFGDADPTAGSPWDKGERLARFVGNQRALLVLDGLEPLQSAHAFERGKLRDPALESLLRGLARQSAGLCLITTREPLTDLATRPGVATRDLDQIDPQAGRALLRTARVVGTDAELEGLAGRFGPHALAVSLLGVYLREQPGHGIGPARALEQLPGKEPIDRVLAGIELWLGDGPEREALRLLGIFDRPADAGCLRALRVAPAIPGLTDRLVGLGEAEWDHVLVRLEKLRLLNLQQGRSSQRTVVDAHPLIREHFAELLKVGDAWRAAHRRLFEHLCAATKDKPQPTLEDLQPLYQAVAHGCQTGMQQEACDDVYRDRILRGKDQYSTKKLGAFGADLGAVACFFEAPWNRLSPALTEPAQAWLLNEAAIRLRALGRLTEALEPMRAVLERDVKQESWKEAAISASNLSELELTLGEVAGAMRDAEQSVTYADRSRDADWPRLSRTTHADALHQAGRRSEAQARFHEAEAMQAKRHTEYRLLYSLQGFRYCDLLLAAAERAAWQCILGSAGFQPAVSGIVPEKTQRAVTDKALSSREEATSNAAQEARRSGQDVLAPEIQSCRAVSQRAARTLQWAEENNLSLLTIALDHLTLGRAALYEAILEGSSLAPCHASLQHAVDGLRRAGQQDDLPRGLLTRAWLRSLTGARTGPDSAQSDLDEAWEIAERGPMPLFLADIHLHRARLFGGLTSAREGAKYPWGSPAADLAAARQLIEKHGYWRRKEELEDAEAAAKTWVRDTDPIRLT